MRILMHLLLISIHGFIAQSCTVVTTTIPEIEVGRSQVLKCIVVDCSLESQGEYIYWQKSISGDWRNLFVYDGATKENAAIATGDEHDLRGRSNGTLVPQEHQLAIDPVILCDGGQWRCIVVSNNIEFPSLTDRTFSVTATTNSDDFKLEPINAAVMLAGRNEEFKCKIDTISPAGTIMWSFDYLEEEGQEFGSSKECGWTIDNHKSKIFDTVGAKEVKCILDQNGKKTDSNLIMYTLKGPPNIEKSGIEVSDPSPLANETYQVTCIASGGDVQISWMLNGQEIHDGSYFTKLPNEDISLPDLPYGQTNATKSVLESKIFLEPTLDSINNQNGTFVCRATVNSHTGNVAVESEGKDVKLRHKPLINGSSSVEVPFDGSAQLFCNCVAPSDVKYSWNQLKNGIAENIQGETEQIYTATQAGNYSCEAGNDLGTAVIFFVLDGKPPIEGQNVGAIVGGCIAAIIVICGCLGLAFFIYKKKAAQKDEEVAAYAESVNTNNGVGTAKSTTNTTTPAVYAEVNKEGKKKSPTKNTPTAVYSEVNIDKKNKPNTKEPTRPVYSQVNTPGRPLPQLQPKPGSTNTGPVYSEVIKPKQGRLTPIENQSHGGSGGDYEAAGGKPLPPIKNKRHYDNAGQRNEHGGLHYADVDFLRQGNGGTKHSHSTKNPAYEPTEYAQIDHRKSAGIVV